MLRILSIAAVALLLFAPAPGCFAEEPGDAAQADEPRYRCSAELQACLDWMAKHYNGRGWAGMQLDADGMTYTVTSVLPGTPADEADIRPGDVLVAVNGVDFLEENTEKLLVFQKQMKPGAQFTYTIKRDGRRRNVNFVLVEMPMDVIALMVGTHLLNDHVDIELAQKFQAD